MGKQTRSTGQSKTSGTVHQGGISTMIIDEMISKAAEESLECYMKSITSDYDPANTFTPSLQFERKISKLTRRANYPYIYGVFHMDSI